MCLQTVFLPGHPTMEFVLSDFGVGFLRSIMTLFLLSCGGFSSSMVSSRFSWCFILLPFLILMIMGSSKQELVRTKPHSFIQFVADQPLFSLSHFL